MSDNALMAVAVIAIAAWLAFIWAGTAYLVGWHDWSPWWFVLTFILSAGSNAKVKS